MKSVYLLIPKTGEAEAWVNENICDDRQEFGGGIAIGHGYIADICNAIDEEGLREHFELVS